MGGVARIDTFFSGWRNGLGQNRGKTREKNFEEGHMCNGEAQQGSEKKAMKTLIRL